MTSSPSTLPSAFMMIFPYFDNVDDQIEKLGGTYPAQTTGTPSVPVHRLRGLLPDRALPVHRAGHDVDGK
jgi:hypothetical protein